MKVFLPKLDAPGEDFPDWQQEFELEVHVNSPSPTPQADVEVESSTAIPKTTTDGELSLSSTAFALAKAVGKLSVKKLSFLRSVFGSAAETAEAVRGGETNKYYGGIELLLFKLDTVDY